MVVKKAIRKSRRTFWGQTIFGKNICSSWSFLDFNPLFFGTLTKMLEYGWPNCILRVQWKSLSRNIFHGKIIFFFIFVYLVKNLFFLAKTSSAGSSYLHSWHPEERTEGKKTFFKINFSNHFRTLTEKHHGFVAEKKRSEGLSNLHFTCPGERFEEFRCGKTSSFLQCLRILSKNNQDIGQKNFSEVAQNEFYVSRGKYWGVFLGKSI